MNLFGKRITLHEAVGDVNLKKARRFIKKGADVNLPNEQGLTPLHIACGFGGPMPYGGVKEFMNRLDEKFLHDTIEMRTLLLDHGANINAVQSPDVPGSSGFTVLHFACSHLADLKVDIIRFLVERGADVNAKSKEGHTPFYYIIRNGLDELVDVFKEHGAVIDVETQHMIDRRAEQEVYKASIDPTSDLRIDRAEMNLSDMWEMKNKITKPLFVALVKTNDINAVNMTRGQKILLTTEELRQEVNNAGFEHYFFDVEGDHAPIALESLVALGANDVHTLLKEAMELLALDDYPRDRRVRWEVLNKIPQKVKERWDELDSRFYDLEQQIEDLQANYIRGHIDEFFRGSENMPQR